MDGSGLSDNLFFASFIQGCSSWVQSEEGRTVTHVAAEQGWVELLEVLINELGCEVDSRCVILGTKHFTQVSCNKFHRRCVRSFL